MKKRKSNLDERQEQKLLEIERNGCWLAFWGLLAALVVEMVAYGMDSFRMLAGEWIVFMALALYLALACLKHGIWDRRLKPNLTTNLIISLIAALALGLVIFASVFAKFPDMLLGSLAAGVMAAVPTFVLCLAALSLSARWLKRKQEKLEQEPEEEDLE